MTAFPLIFDCIGDSNYCQLTEKFNESHDADRHPAAEIRQNDSRDFALKRCGSLVVVIRVLVRCAFSATMRG